MFTDAFQAEIKAKNGNMSDKTILINELKTKEQVEELKKFLSDDHLQIGQLTIEIDEGIVDFFMTEFTKIQKYPKISHLSLPAIHLSHDNWNNFFKALHRFESLNCLNIDNSNFDYSNDLRYLGEYLASNPALKKIQLRHDKKVDDSTFTSGDKERELFEYLKTNTNLVDFGYGHKWDVALRSNLSKEIQSKLQTNARVDTTKVNINKAVANLKDDFIQRAHTYLDDSIVKSITDCLRKGTNEETKIELDINDMHISRKQMHLALMEMSQLIDLATLDKEFNNSDQMAKVKNTYNYYYSQYYLLNAIDEMYKREVQASPHDKSILHNLREDLLQQWKSIAAIKKQDDKNSKMEQFIGTMINRCAKDGAIVKDKTNSALIKNVLLLLSAFLTFGLSLGIYAVVSTKSIAERGSFFFKDKELSKGAIDGLKEKFEEVESSRKNIL